jgi:serine/threonine protein kinase
MTWRHVSSRSRSLPQRSVWRAAVAISPSRGHDFQSSSLGSPVTAVDSPIANALRDRYDLERELGRGGMATVYLAQDVKHNRRVAVKGLRCGRCRADEGGPPSR